MTLAEFLTGLVGERVAFIQDDRKVEGILAAVTATDDDHNPFAYVDSGPVIAVGACTRIKFHFNPTEKDRRR